MNRRSFIQTLTALLIPAGMIKSKPDYIPARLTNEYTVSKKQYDLYISKEAIEDIRNWTHDCIELQHVLNEPLINQVC